MYREKDNEMDLNTMEYKCKTPVIFIFFNRPQTMVHVLEQIRKAKPDKLYLVADGPRNEEEKRRTEECRRIAKEMVDWECQVVQVYAEKNMGCRDRVVSGISYVLQREEKAVILEDDCVPNISFFRFMDDILERYKDNEAIFSASGRNHFGKYDEKKYDYHFTHHGSIWGWGTWARSWQLYDINMTHWPEIRDKNGGHIREWMRWRTWICRKKLYEDIYRGKIDTWDYQMNFSLQYHRKICITSSVNLVQNIGNGNDATHTVGKNRLFNVPVYELNIPLRHPEKVAVNRGYDKAYSRKIIEKGFWGFGKYCFIQLSKQLLKIITGKEYGRKDFPNIFK